MNERLNKRTNERNKERSKQTNKEKQENKKRKQGKKLEIKRRKKQRERCKVHFTQVRTSFQFVVFLPLDIELSDFGSESLHLVFHASTFSFMQIIQIRSEDKQKQTQSRNQLFLRLLMWANSYSSDGFTDGYTFLKGATSLLYEHTIKVDYSAQPQDAILREKLRCHRRALTSTMRNCFQTRSRINLFALFA